MNIFVLECKKKMFLEEPQGSFGKFYDQGPPSIKEWFEKLRKLKRFLLGHNRRPRINSVDTNEKKLARWERIQLSSSKKGLRRGLMMHDEIFNAWSQFLKS